MTSVTSSTTPADISTIITSLINQHKFVKTHTSTDDLFVADDDIAPAADSNTLAQ